MNRSALISLLVGGLCLGSSLAGWAATANPCREARRSFRDGLNAYDRRSWEEVGTAMLAVLRSECDQPEKIFIPYGRWVYSYRPGLYLAVAMSQCHRCETAERPASKTCEVPVAWWSSLEANEMQALTSCAACSGQVDASSGRCDLAVDWWQKLEATRGNVVELVESYRANGCENLTSPLPLFRKVLLGQDEDPYLAACAALLDRLADHLESCRASLPRALPAAYSCPFPDAR